MLLINLAVGVITRSSPQLNLFSFAFPISLLAIFILFYINRGSDVSHAERPWDLGDGVPAALVMEAVTYG